VSGALVGADLADPTTEQRSTSAGPGVLAWVQVIATLCAVCTFIYLAVGEQPLTYRSAAIFFVAMGTGLARVHAALKQLFDRIQQLETELASLRRTDPRE
jgi:hypothetical protein